MRRGGVGSRPHRFLGFLLAVLAITQVTCNGEDDPKLVIEDNALGSWIAINNTFAIPPVTDPSNYYWTGILFQIANFTPPPPGVRPPRWQFDRVMFSKQGNPVGTDLDLVWTNYPSGKAFWINIVSKKRSASHLDPLRSTDVLALYPGDYPPGHLCFGITADPVCLRTAKLHAGMDHVVGLITYWQGANGFELEAKQEGALLGSRFEFRLKDEFTVEVYEITSGIAGRSVTPTPVATHGPGTIDLITVKRRPGGPSDGDKQDPPWPPPP